MQNYPVFNCKNGDDVLKAVKEYNVSFVQFWFVDILGTLKSFQITPNELEAAFEEGMGFDGSSILGFTRIHESDMVAFPDPTTFQICSWRPTDRPVARMFCDVKNPDGTPYEADSRYVLKRVIEKAAQKGYSYFVDPSWSSSFSLLPSLPRSWTAAATSTLLLWTWPTTCAGTSFSACSPWAFPLNTATTRLPPASMRSICAIRTA